VSTIQETEKENGGGKEKGGEKNTGGKKKRNGDGDPPMSVGRENSKKAGSGKSDPERKKEREKTKWKKGKRTIHSELKEDRGRAAGEKRAQKKASYRRRQVTSYIYESRVVKERRDKRWEPESAARRGKRGGKK